MINENSPKAVTPVTSIFEHEFHEKNLKIAKGNRFCFCHLIPTSNELLNTTFRNSKRVTSGLPKVE